MNPSIDKLKAIAKFLKTSGKFYFQNYNLSLFTTYIQEDDLLNVTMESLLDTYSEVSLKAKEMATSGIITVVEGDETKSFSIAQYRSKINSFNMWVAFCYSYIQHIGTNSGNKVIDNFIVDTGVDSDNEDLSPKLQFYNDCIEPICIYLELQLKLTLNATSILQRYKVLCEWYEREKINSMDEVPITKNHLSRYLFDQGYTYTFSETNVPSGRIDSLATSIGLSKEQLHKLPNIIIAEGKIFKSAKKAISDVKAQVHKRVNELNIDEGYCVIYNKSKKQIQLTDSVNSINGLCYAIIEGKKIFFLVVNLNEAFYDSTRQIETIDISIK